MTDIYVSCFVLFSFECNFCFVQDERSLAPARRDDFCLYRISLPPPTPCQCLRDDCKNCTWKELTYTRFDLYVTCPLQTNNTYTIWVVRGVINFSFHPTCYYLKVSGFVLCWTISNEACSDNVYSRRGHKSGWQNERSEELRAKIWRGRREARHLPCSWFDQST